MPREIIYVSGLGILYVLSFRLVRLKITVKKKKHYLRFKVYFCLLRNNDFSMISKIHINESLTW